MVRKQPSKRHEGDFTQTDLLNKIIAMNPGKIVPIISNSFRVGQIFCDETAMIDFFADTREEDEEALTIEEQLTRVWAGQIRYPMGDPWNLARVAHYHQIRNKDSEIAKKEYVDFLKSYLLEITSDDNNAGLVEQLRPESLTLPFSEIVRKLKYPRFPEGIEDPLSQLARLPSPIYVTTSYFDFLERAARRRCPDGSRAKARTEEGRRAESAETLSDQSSSVSSALLPPAP